MCYCGCSDLTVKTCTCGTAAAIRQEIAQRLADAQTVEQVTAVFVARHGEKILSAPTFQGFNLVAWITPFAVLFLAGTGVVLFVRRRGVPHPQARAESPGQAAPAPGLSPREKELMQRVEREIREGR
jgi:cytochrome c-type biogenesis protein CcmH